MAPNVGLSVSGTCNEFSLFLSFPLVWVRNGGNSSCVINPMVAPSETHCKELDTIDKWVSGPIIGLDFEKVGPTMDLKRVLHHTIMQWHWIVALPSYHIFGFFSFFKTIKVKRRNVNNDKFINFENLPISTIFTPHLHM